MLQTNPRRWYAIAIAAFTLAVCAHAQANEAFVTGKTGMTFYTYDADVPGSGKSVCVEQCLAHWPAVPASAASGKEFGSLQRADGSHQLTYQGQPVYYYRDDHQPGDALGDGKGGAWHALRATTQSSTHTERDKNNYSGY